MQTRFTAITGGQADMECGSSTVTLGRMREVDFSSFIFVEFDRRRRHPQSPHLHAFTDHDGKKIAVIAGTTNEAALKRAKPAARPQSDGVHREGPRRGDGRA